MSKKCVNYNSCPLINKSGFLSDHDKVEQYVISYCKAGEANWSACKRYLTKAELHFCPDFVLPDTVSTTDEILERFEKEN